MPGELNVGGFTFGSSEGASARPVEPQAPFHICVIGDFGSDAAGETPLARRRPFQINRDNFDEMLERLNVVFRCEMPEGQADAEVPINSLDDFHPDHLVETVATFESLQTLRRQLLNPKTFGQAAEKVRRWLPEPAAGESQPASSSAEPTAPVDSGNLLEGILDAADAEASARRPGEIDWNAMIREIVRPYSIPAADPQQDVLVECVDAVTSRTMTALLHHPRFRNLEAAWRGLWLLVRRLETDSRLKVFLLQATRDELAADVADAEESAGLRRQLVDQTVGTPGAHPWALLLSLEWFHPLDEDARLLGGLLAVAQSAGAPLIAAASGEFVGCPPGRTNDPDDWDSPRLSDGWQELRQSTAAGWGCLIWPSFLLRLPYGAKTSPVDGFAYEEITSTPRRDDYLWGNPSFIAGCLLGQSYSESGWNLRIGQQPEFTGLPLHVYQEDGESIARPCTEVPLSVTSAGRVRGCGLTPLWAVRDRDEVQLPMLQSLAGGPLAERWSN